MINAQIFAEKFQLIRRSLQAAIGDERIAHLAALSLVSGSPLLLESPHSQRAIALAMAHVIDGAFDETSWSDTFDERQKRATVFYMDGIDSTYFKTVSTMMTFMFDAGDESYVLVARTGTPSRGYNQAANFPEAFADRFGLLATGLVDCSAVVNAEPVITRQELVEMRQFGKSVEAPHAVLELIVDISRELKPSGSTLPAELQEMVEEGPSMRATVMLRILSAFTAAANGRNATNFDDVRAIAEDALAHRIKPSIVSAYTRFALGHRLVQALLKVMPNPDPSTAQEDADTLMGWAQTT